MLTDKQRGYNALRVNGLTPDTRREALGLLSDLENIGLYFLITFGLRTFDEQDALYRIGRRGIIGEKIVTNARGGESWHNYGRAIDLVLVTGNGVVNWQDIDSNSDGHADYSQMGWMAENRGFRWGGDFSFRDLGHIEFHPGLTIEDMKEGKG